MLSAYLSVIASRKHCLFPNPSAERQTLSPVPVHDKATISSWKITIEKPVKSYLYKRRDGGFIIKVKPHRKTSFSEKKNQIVT